MAVVFPDTSPRGVVIPGHDDSQYDLGSGAGFYINATNGAWAQNYKMESYVTEELPKLIEQLFTLDMTKQSITGHSMGGHGALTLYLKNPGKYKSVSAFAPICNPTACPWGVKAFTAYLGSVEAGKAHDATELMATYSGPKTPILIDQGTSDEFLEPQLMPKNFQAACFKAGQPVMLRM